MRKAVQHSPGNNPCSEAERALIYQEVKRKFVEAGAWTLGLGAATGAVGAIVLGTGGFAGVFMLTAGAVLLLAGIVIMITVAAVSSE